MYTSIYHTHDTYPPPPPSSAYISLHPHSGLLRPAITIFSVRWCYIIGICVFIWCCVGVGCCVYNVRGNVGGLQCFVTFSSFLWDLILSQCRGPADVGDHGLPHSLSLSLNFHLLLFLLFHPYTFPFVYPLLYNLGFFYLLNFALLSFLFSLWETILFFVCFCWMLRV